VRLGLDRLVRPRSVAIVGASADPTRTAGRPAVYLRKHGYTGKLFLVNPRVRAIDGLECYPSVADLPEAPDVGLVLLGRERAVQAVRALDARGAGAAIVLAGGFAEVDATGAAHQAELRAAAGSMRLLGPNTIGLVNVADATALSASVALEVFPLPVGGISVVAQSGGILSALLSRGAAHGVGFSKLISTGNEADIDGSEVIEYLVEDEATSVIALYVESVRRPQQFRRAAQAAARRGTPLVVFKVGRSEAGAQSATSHTGAMAGADQLYEALFEQTGALRVATFGELIDVSAALASGKRLAGRRVAILTSTGGGGALVADACGLRGLEVPPPDPATVTRLQALLVGESALAERNPVDVTLAGIQADIYREAIAALLDSPTYDAVVVVVGASGLAQPDLAADPVLSLAAGSSKPLVVYVSPHALDIVSKLNRANVPAFDTPEGCAAGLSALRRVAPPPSAPRSGRAVQGGAAPPGKLKEGRRLDEVESKALFAEYGIPCVREYAVRSPEEAAAAAQRLGGPVVVKIRSREVAHKTDVGGVRLGVRPEEVAACCQRMPSPEGWVIQEQVTQGVEMLLGLVRDPQLGLAVMLGAGGIATEVFGDTSLRLLPLRPGDAQHMLEALKSDVLLQGFRGRPRADIPALLEAVEGFARLGEDLGERLLEAEINPLFVLPEGQGVVAADGLVVLG
jgi:acyl-CoA synthetase (NDP forming)